MTAKIPVAGQSVKAKTSAQGAVLTDCPATPLLVLIMESSFYVNLLLEDRPRSAVELARPEVVAHGVPHGPADLDRQHPLLQALELLQVVLDHLSNVWCRHKRV